MCRARKPCRMRGVAARMGISPHTAKVFMRLIYVKLGTDNRTHAVALAFRNVDLPLTAT
jgi:DNA-binding CsgD family transcriptional regulator